MDTVTEGEMAVAMSSVRAADGARAVSSTLGFGCLGQLGAEVCAPLSLGSLLSSVTRTACAASTAACVPTCTLPDTTIPTHTPPQPTPQLGGMGFIHYNNTIAEQLSNVLKVKRHIPGFVVTPAVLGPDATVDDIFKLRVREGEGGLGPRL